MWKFRLSPELSLFTVTLLLSGCGEQAVEVEDFGFEGSGKDGAPVSLEEHAILACQDLLEYTWDFKLKNAEGQGRDILQEQWEKISESTVCGCAVDVLKLPGFAVGLDRRSDPPFGPYVTDKVAYNIPGLHITSPYDEGVNSGLAEHRETGKLAYMYKTFKNYSIEEVSSEVRVIHHSVQNILWENAEVCLAGFDPDAGRVIEGGWGEQFLGHRWEYVFDQ
jgi:hypothetical protein